MSQRHKRAPDPPRATIIGADMNFAIVINTLLINHRPKLSDSIPNAYLTKWDINSSIFIDPAF